MISGTMSLPDNRIEIKAEIPLSELGNYQSRLKSVSGGEGSYTMAFSHYSQVPSKIQKELVDVYKPDHGDS